MTNFRFNIIYLVLILALLGSYFFLKNSAKEAHLFYGVADNQETEISHDEAVTIKKIFVQAGESVKKGTPLLAVERTDLAIRMENLDLNTQDIQVKQQLNKVELDAKILQLKAEKQEKKAEFDAKIKTIQVEADYNQWLSKDLKTIKSDATKTENSYSGAEVKIQALKDEMSSALAIYDTRINHLQSAIGQVSRPYSVDLKKIKSAKAALKSDIESLTILAPSDGIVGNLRCRVGEHKAAREVLVSFYEKSPNLVVGYVQESLLVLIKEGDSVKVNSHVRKDIGYAGKIQGLGYRVVEIPERLRRFPEIKTYGREVLIRIPSENEFLQNEKVQLFVGG